MGETFSSTDTNTGTSQRITSGYARYVFWVMFGISFLNCRARRRIRRSLDEERYRSC